MRGQLELALQSAINPRQRAKRPASSDVLLLDNVRSLEEELVLVLDEGVGSHLVASPRSSHAAPIAEAVSP